MLVAISIPIFTTQLEKSREAVDESNIRAAYAEVMAAALTDSKKDEGDVKYNASTGYSKEVVLTQQEDGWTTGITDIGGVSVTDAIAKKGGTVVVAATAAGSPSITLK